MSSQPVPSLTQAGIGHWKCPLKKEEEGEDEHEQERERQQDGKQEGNGGSVYTRKLILV